MKSWLNIGRMIPIISIVLLILLSFNSCQCQYGDPGVSITVVNETDDLVSIYVDGWLEYSVPPRASKEFTTIAISPINVYSENKEFLIEAKTKSGDIIYSKKFSWQELHDMNWKIVIPPSKN